MASKYVPPAMRNAKKETVHESPKKFEPRRNYKPQWEVERESNEEVVKQKALEEEKGRELTDNNFPRLVALPTKLSVWGGSRSFADLANEWKEKTVEDEISKKNAEDEKNEERTYVYRQNLPLPKFHNVRRFVEADDEEDSYVEAAPQANPTDDDSGWTLVDRKKVRREKTFEEKLAAHAETTDDSVWNADAPEEHETCWDDKPY